MASRRACGASGAAGAAPPDPIQAVVHQINAQCRHVQGLRVSGADPGTLKEAIEELQQLKQRLSSLDPAHRLALGDRDARKTEERQQKESRVTRAAVKTAQQEAARREYHRLVAAKEAEHHRAVAQLRAQHRAELEELRREHRQPVPCAVLHPGGAAPESGGAAPGGSAPPDPGRLDADQHQWLVLHGPSEDAACAPRRVTRAGAKLRPQNWGYTTYLDRVFAMRAFHDLIALGVFQSAKDVSESMGALQAATVHGFDNGDAAQSPETECPAGGVGGGGGQAPTDPVRATRSGPEAREDGAPRPDPQPPADGGASRAAPGLGCWRRRDVLCLVIGDGCTPRTAALVAFLTQWTAVSIDPEMLPEWVGRCPRGVRRLRAVRGTFEAWVEGLADAAGSGGGGIAGAEGGGVAQAEGDGGGALPGPAPCFRQLLLLCVHSHNRFTGPAAIGSVRSALGLQHVPCCLVFVPCCPGFSPGKDIGRPPDVTFEDLAVFSACRRVQAWKWAAAAGAVCPGAVR